jgi:hypothetical protein
MGVFNSSRVYYASPALIPLVASDIADAFRAHGYEVSHQPLLAGGADLSLRKGGMFKAVLGMKTALKVVIQPQGTNIVADASIGIFGQQAVPMVISMFFLWPVLLTQVWGMVEQSNLDDQVLQKIGEAIERRRAAAPETAAMAGGANRRFCTGCATPLSAGARFCPACGQAAGASL